MFCKVGILSIIARKKWDEEVEVWKLLIANLISKLRKKMSAQNKPECEIYKKKPECEFFLMENIYGFINLWNCHLLGKKNWS